MNNEQIPLIDKDLTTMEDEFWNNLKGDGCAVLFFWMGPIKGLE